METYGIDALMHPTDVQQDIAADANVFEYTGSRTEFIHKPLPTNDPKQRKPDIALATKELGWVPKVALEDGLKPTIAYFDQLLKKQAL